jgi:hypothetical protein
VKAVTTTVSANRIIRVGSSPSSRGPESQIVATATAGMVSPIQ